MLTPRVKNSGRVWRHGLRSLKQTEIHGPWFYQGKWPGGHTVIYSRKSWVRLMRTPLTLDSHHSFTRNPGKSLIFPSTFISYLPLVAHISLHSSLSVALTFPGPRRRPCSCIARPRGRQFPSCVLQARQIFSTSLPPTQSLPLAFCAHFHVGPSLWRQLVPQSVWSDLLLFSLLPPPFQRSVVKPLLNEKCCGSEKKGTTQIIFPEKVNSLSRVSKYSTWVRVSHPTVWLFALCCGMLLMSHSSRLDWSAHFTLFPSASLSPLNS